MEDYLTFLLYVSSDGLDKLASYLIPSAVTVARHSPTVDHDVLKGDLSFHVGAGRF